MRQVKSYFSNFSVFHFDYFLLQLFLGIKSMVVFAFMLLWETVKSTEHETALAIISELTELFFTAETFFTVNLPILFFLFFFLMFTFLSVMLLDLGIAIFRIACLIFCLFIGCFFPELMGCYL